MRIPSLRRSSVLLAASALLSAIPVVTSAQLAAAPALAASTAFYFHGTPADQANKATPPGTATFNTTAPTGTAPVTQSTNPVANHGIAGCALAAYWSWPFSTP